MTDTFAPARERRVHLTSIHPVRPPQSRLDELLAAGRRNDARKLAAELKARTTLDLMMHRKRGWK
jgi:hypothetical protein